MNTNNLKRFAQGARRKLLEQVSSKLDFVLSHDSSTLRARSETLKRLNDELESVGRKAIVDKVAYIWFNRLVALRFMDANGFQPMGIHVLTPVSGISPQILDEAHAGHISEELTLRREEVMNILDGRVSSVNPDNEAYRILLVASCNHLSSIFPFLFERINDYTELLLPDDLTSPFSIIKDILNGMSEEDCQEVEIIGWLYQFYISEKKDEVFASGEKVKKEDIPAATQLFTPRWIVEYMVQNTLGKLWLQNRPNSKLRDFMPYYIESPSSKSDDFLKVNSVEEITLLDQASGSGHILVYGFELFSKIYEEEGYASSEIPQLIIEKNLFGFEIDERAAQLAGFALMMKARSYHRRFFRKEVKPNILCFQDLRIAENEIKPLLKDLGISISDELFHDLKTMKQATNFGSLIQPNTDKKTLEETRNTLQSKLQRADIFSKPKIENLIKTISQLILLSKKHQCIVDNPPYMGGGNMNKELSEFVKINYPDSKADLMACFMEAGLKSLMEKGFLGMINQQSWMFLSSYEVLRKKLIRNTFIETLLHLGPRTFPEIGGEVVQNAAFTFQNKKPEDYGVYISLVKHDKTDVKKEKTIEAINNSSCGWLFYSRQINFEKIPGYPIGYWFTDSLIEIFKNTPVGTIAPVRKGNSTSNNARFLRFGFEINRKNHSLRYSSIKNSLDDKKNWIPYNKGGGYKKWYGFQEYVVNWKDNGKEIREIKTSVVTNEGFYMKPGLTWSTVSSSDFSLRWFEAGFIFDNGGCCLFIDDLVDRKIILGVMNSKVFKNVLSGINPTLNFQSGEVSKFPIIWPVENSKVISIVDENVEISKEDWNSNETSWEYLEHPFFKFNLQDIEESYDLYKQVWKNKLLILHKNEQELNRIFIEIYRLEGELTLEVPIEELTILKEETGIVNGQLVFYADEVFAQFISYAVGCTFGRYSLDKEGLILANQGETVEDYFNKIERLQYEVSYLPDGDNIIPILDDVWFEDDIVFRFHEFLKASFGEKNFRKNLSFVEECLGKDIRSYFVKDFYKDHIKRYKKRPIYWSFSSPNGYFNVLIYMHRYTPDTLNRILNNYLREFIEKLQAHRKNLLHIEVSGTPTEQNKARKEINKLDEMIADCRLYETDILYPLATERISIDLDEGVLVNYNKFGKAITEVAGLNDKKAKQKVREFDWIDKSTIR